MAKEVLGNPKQSLIPWRFQSSESTPLTTFLSPYSLSLAWLSFSISIPALRYSEIPRRGFITRVFSKFSKHCSSRELPVLIPYC